MSAEITNPYLAFYGEHRISPVHQNIQDMPLHQARRRKLYRTLGVPPALFQGRRVLEVGPGSGYNTLVLFHWQATVDLVEPNPTAREELIELFSSHGIDPLRWTVISQTIEAYKPGIAYPVVMAEGFIPALRSRADALASLSLLTQPGGVLIVTCQDGISFFVEQLKRLVARRLVRGIKGFTDKVALLSQAFQPHLHALKGASRPISDWVADLFLAPTPYSNSFSMEDCLCELGDDFEFLGSSPDLFTDYSWYKDLDAGAKEERIREFREKRHLLILKDMPESRRRAQDNQHLADAVDVLRDLARQQEDRQSEELDYAVLSQLSEIGGLVSAVDPALPDLVNECRALLQDPGLSADVVSRAPHLTCACGRAQQYMSMLKIA